MESFQVPQYIEEESRLIGSFTFTQILILLFGGGIIYLSYTLLASWFSLIIIVITASITIVLAFVQVDGMPTYKLIMPLIRHIWLPRIYIWGKPKEINKRTVNTKKDIVKPVSTPMKNKIDIKELSQILNKEKK